MDLLSKQRSVANLFFAKRKILWVLTIVAAASTVYFGNEISTDWLSSNSHYRNLVEDGKVYPSHVEICKRIVFNQNDQEADSDILLSEKETFCRNDQDTYHNLLQVFTSAMLSSSSGRKNIVYRHGCSQYYDPEDRNLNNLLMKLPENVLEDALATSDEVVNLCSQFLEENSHYSINTILNDGRWTQKLVEKIIRNIRLAYCSRFFMCDQVNQGETENQIQQEEEQHQRRLLANPNSDAPSHDGLDTTMIYLDNQKTLPLNAYISLIPRSTTNVNILTSSLTPLVTDLQSYLKVLIPRASIQVQETSSSLNEETVETMLTAETLICLSDVCSFAALARVRTTVLVRNDSWMNHVDTVTMHPTILWVPHSTLIPVEDFSASVTSDFFTSSDFCSHTRGRAGVWVKDLDFASKLQYISPLNHIFGFADERYIPSPENPYRAPTTYRWQDDVCPINVHTHESFCQLLGNEITRILFVGDFVSMNQAYSLWKILGHEDTPKPMTEKEPNWEREFMCGDKKIAFQFIRNDMLVENDNPVDLPRKLSNCASVYCYKWTEDYLKYYADNDPNKRSLVIFNFGAHFYSDNDFAEQMKIFLNTIDSVMDSHFGKDLIFFRTTSPGHHQCNRNKANVPFDNFEQYRETITWRYSWDLHDGFNDIADRMIREFNQVRSKSPSMYGLQPINMLDVYPMTILRRDGHVGGKDCRRCNVGNDCFYYSLPGPSDWWNHLLLSNLQDHFAVKPIEQEQ